MVAPRPWTLGALLLAASLISVGAVPCTYTEHGMRFDLCPLVQSKFYQIREDADKTIYFNICADVVEDSSSSSSPFYQCHKVVAGPSPATAWEVQVERNTKSCGSLGETASQSFALIEPNDPERGVRITYANGMLCNPDPKGQQHEKAKLTIEIVCDKTKVPGVPISFHQTTGCDGTIAFRSVHGCPSPAGLSKGGWFMVAYLGAWALYFGIGVAVNMRRGITGVEAIPHLDFWRDLPALVRDGADFLIGKYHAMREQSS